MGLIVTLPLKPFRVVVLDPPWEYNDRKKHRRDNPAGETRFGMGACVYEGDKHGNGGIHSVSYIAEQLAPLNRVVTNDVYVFMWATAPNLPAALELGDLLGLRYVTTAFVWVKVTSKSKSIWAGPGAYTLSNVEYLLLFRPKVGAGKCWHASVGKKGSKNPKPKQVMMLPHVMDENKKIIHSRKPYEFKRVIQDWLKEPILEVFATEVDDCDGGWIGTAIYDGEDHPTDALEDLRALANVLASDVSFNQALQIGEVNDTHEASQ